MKEFTSVLKELFASVPEPMSGGNTPTDKLNQLMNESKNKKKGCTLDAKGKCCKDKDKDLKPDLSGSEDDSGNGIKSISELQNYMQYGDANNLTKSKGYRAKNNYINDNPEYMNNMNVLNEQNKLYKAKPTSNHNSNNRT